MNMAGSIWHSVFPIAGELAGLAGGGLCVNLRRPVVLDLPEHETTNLKPD